MKRKSTDEEKGEVDEAGNRESSNDGSDQRITCQTLEVISCFIEDFYGIPAVEPTSLSLCLTVSSLSSLTTFVADGSKPHLHHQTNKKESMPKLRTTISFQKPIILRA